MRSQAAGVANWRRARKLLKAQFKLGKCKMVPTTRIEDGVNCSSDPDARLLPDVAAAASRRFVQLWTITRPIPSS